MKQNNPKHAEAKQTYTVLKTKKMLLLEISVRTQHAEKGIFDNNHKAQFSIN